MVDYTRQEVEPLTDSELLQLDTNRNSTLLFGEVESNVDTTGFPEKPQEYGYWFRNWPRFSAALAMPGDEVARTAWKQVMEIPENFKRGLRKSRYDYQQAAQNIVIDIADRMGLDFDARKDFLGASQARLKQMPLHSTSQDWEDQLFYLIGHYIPDTALAVIGGGVMGKFVGSGAKAAKMGQGYANMAAFVGTVMGDTAVNIASEMAHEAGDAQLEGREARYAERGGEAAAMSLLMSFTGRVGQALQFNRKTNALLTGGVMGGVSALHGGDGDTVLAHSILGGMFGLFTGTGRAGYSDINKWIKARRERELPVSFAHYVQEFAPDTYKRLFVDEVNLDRLRYERSAESINPRMLGPKDKLLWNLQRTMLTETPEGTKIMDIWGYSDNQLVKTMADYAEMRGTLRVKDAGSLKHIEGQPREIAERNAKTFIDAVNTVNKEYLKENPNYRSLYEYYEWPVPKRAEKPLVRAISKERHQKEIQNAQQPLSELARNIPMSAEGYVAYATSKGKKKGLFLHQLSRSQALELFGTKTPNSRTNSRIEQLHKDTVVRSAEGFETANKETWPALNALIEYNMIPEYGWIHTREKFAQVLKGDETINKLGEQYLTKVRESGVKAKIALDEIDVKVKQGWLEEGYKAFVDPSGRMYNFLEKADHPAAIKARNAHMRRYVQDDRLSLLNEELDLAVWGDIDPNYHNLLSAYYVLRTETDFALRRSASKREPLKGVNREVWPGNEIPGLTAEKIPYMLDTFLTQADDFTQGREGILRRVDHVKSTYKTILDKLHKKGMIRTSTYDKIKDFYYLPQRSIVELERDAFIYKIGARKNPAVSSYKELIKDLKTRSVEDRYVDLEFLTKNYVSLHEHLMTQNDFIRSVADMADHVDFVSKTKPTVLGKPKLTFLEYNYIRDGEQASIWVEGNLAQFMESGNISNWDQVGNIKQAMAWVAGAHTVRLSAVGLNIFFAPVTHSLDVAHIFTHHPSLSWNVPKLFYDFEIYNKERGALPFIQNVKSALFKDKTYKQYLEDDGVTATLISQVAQQELIKKAKTKGLVPEKATEGVANYYNRFLEAFSKFNHVMEVATRMTEGDMLMSTGKFKTKSDANLESLRRINYYRRGKWLRHVDFAIPFSNAAAQYLASNLSELKPGKSVSHNRMRALAVMAQLAAGIGLMRMWSEETHPGFHKKIPWDMRRRYWTIPTSMTRINNKTGNVDGVYLAIKKNYNPIFGIMDGMVDLWQDYAYYGKEGLPPINVIRSFYDTIKVSTPVELRSIVPPALNALTIATFGYDLSGRRTYKHEARHAEHEINSSLTGGKETAAWAVEMGELFKASPAKIEGVADTYFARNPLTYMIGDTLFPEDSVIQQTAVDQLLKTAGSRLIFKSTREGWADFERSQNFIEQGNSRVYENVTQYIENSINRYRNLEINYNQLYTEAISAVGVNPEYQAKVVKRLKREKKAFEYFKSILKMASTEEEIHDVYDNLGNWTFWNQMSKMYDEDSKAEYYFDKWLETDPPWRKLLDQMAGSYGYRTGLFERKLKQLKRRHTQHQKEMQGD